MLLQSGRLLHATFSISSTLSRFPLFAIHPCCSKPILLNRKLKSNFIVNHHNNHRLPSTSRGLSDNSNSNSNSITYPHLRSPVAMAVKVQNPHRLARTLVPLTYDLRIRPDLDGSKFDGQVLIRLSVLEDDVDEIRLHCVNLQVKEVKVSRGSDEMIEVKKYELEPSWEGLSIALASKIQSGEKVELFIRYAGEMTDRLRGFYRTKQQSSKFAGVCHFEASDARSAFPCWDDPAFRAEFAIELEVPKGSGLVVLSNMPESGRSPVEGEPDVERVVFSRTPSIPTYLVCWSLGEYDHLESRSAGGIPVRVFTPLGQKENGRLALEVATKALDFYTEFFSVTYKLPKMDLIALPDFPIGAMENWGLLTFKERMLLFDQDKSSANCKQNVALVVAHEVAHQWFGNLVTVDWWTHLWLKEGYATWIEYLCVDRLFPSWRAWDQFMSDVASPARTLDALSNTHPVEVEVATPAQIDEIFDVISYKKGCAIIRMLFGFVGEEKFRKGMNLYLERHAYGNARTEDLWKALEEASGKDVGGVMSKWTLEEGFPLISVTNVKKGEDQLTITIRQSRFTAAGGEEKDTTLWTVPFTITSKSSPVKPVYIGLLKEREETIVLSGIAKDDWINLNPGSVGFYRVCYTQELLDRFFPSVSAEDRLSLLDDQLALAVSGRIKTVDLLRFLGHFRQEDDAGVWAVVSTCLARLREMATVGSDGTDRDSFNAWHRWFLRPAMKRLGWGDAGEKGDHLRSLFRSSVVAGLVKCEDEETLTEAARLFDDGEEVQPDLRSVLYSAKMKRDGRTTWEKLVAMASSDECSSEDRLEIYMSLGSTRDEQLLRESLALSLSPSVRAQDTHGVIAGVAVGSAKGRELAWRFFQERQDEMRARYAKGGLLTHIVRAVTTKFGRTEDAEEVEKFFRENPFPGAERTVAQAAEEIRLRASWRKRDSRDAKAFMEQQIKSDS